MTTTTIVRLFLAANTVASLALFIALLVRNRRAAVGCLLVSLFAPVIGLLMCLVMAFPFKKGRYAIGAEESIRKMKMKEMEYVDMDRLMSTVPVNDALTLSNDSDRRRYLLGLLRQREMDSLREVLHQAVYTNDSEASHYAASAIMELQRVSYGNMDEAAKAYVPGPEGSYQAAQRYAVAILLYLENSELGQMENYTFRKRYEDVVVDILQNHRDDCSGEDYGNMVRFMLRQGRLDEAAEYAQAYIQAFPAEESGYFLLMQIAYQRHDGALFRETMDRLQHSEAVLSPQGLGVVRFWQQPAAGRAAL